MQRETKIVIDTLLWAIHPEEKVTSMTKQRVRREILAKIETVNPDLFIACTKLNNTHLYEVLAEITKDI